MRRRGMGRSRRTPSAPAVGLFGGFGCGNLGNDASLEAILGYLRSAHPDALIDIMCGGAQRVRDRYGIPATPTQWYEAKGMWAHGRQRAALKVIGKIADTFRLAIWVRRHDAVIVPGMGVLETTLTLRPWQFPYTMFALCASGRILGTKVALVSVGSNVIPRGLNRWLLISAARSAFYRSYRDVMSKEAIAAQGIDTTADHVYTDLVLGTETPAGVRGDPQTVGLGVMDFYGSNDDNFRQVDQIHDSYVEKLRCFVRWLVDDGRKVRLFVGDTNGSDLAVVEDILSDIRACRPDLDPGRVAWQPVSTYGELMQAMESVGSVVVTRYHNLVCALAMHKPTISIGYAPKNTVLMKRMGLAEYCQDISSLDVSKLTEQLISLESRAAEVSKIIGAHSAENVRLVQQQFAELSALVFPHSAAARASTEQRVRPEAVG